MSKHEKEKTEAERKAQEAASTFGGGVNKAVEAIRKNAQARKERLDNL